LERASDGWVLHYAIADVAAFIVPGDAVDLASRARGSTLYLPDGSAPLHPRTLSEGAASLLPGEARPAMWWRLTFDAEAELSETEVTRATVRVRVATSYSVITAILDDADADHAGDSDSDTLDGGGSDGDNVTTGADADSYTASAPEAPAAPGHAIDLQAPNGDALEVAASRGIDLLEVATVLRDFGSQRLALQAQRGGVSLQLPEQDVEVSGSGEVQLVARPSLPAEEWNAQMSLATGIAAAQLMLRAETGLLRTLPDAEPEILEELERASTALGQPWPDADQSPTHVYAEWVRSLDPFTPIGAALMLTATKGLRGSGYSAFHGELPELTTHAAVAAPYAHVTAPLRRLGDRYAAELALAAYETRPAPAWVLDVLDDLPQILNDGNRRSSAVDRAVVDLLEAAVLAPQVGDEFAAVVLSHGRDGVRVQVTEPPVIADASGAADDGQAVTVRLVEADPMERQTRFAIDH
jgi:exoribonuclease R